MDLNKPPSKHYTSIPRRSGKSRTAAEVQEELLNAGKVVVTISRNKMERRRRKNGLTIITLLES